MLSIIEITFALVLGILWGLYLELRFLIITSIFLYFLVLMFYKKYNWICVILLIIAILSCFYTKEKIENYNEKYSDKLLVNMKVTIITYLEEGKYTYKYHGKNEQGDKFILYFKKNESNIFKVGEKIQVTGEFNLPDLARNRGGFNYRRYLNSNGIYGTIFISCSEKIPKELKFTNLIYGVQNLIHENFQKLLSKEKARNIKWNVNTVKQLLYQMKQKIIFKWLE